MPTDEVQISDLISPSQGYVPLAELLNNIGTLLMFAIDDKTRTVAMLTSSVLFRTFLLGAGVLLLSCIPVLFMTDQIYAIHSTMIDIPRPEYNAILFTYLADMKVLLLTFFLFPAIAIRWALKGA
jgi:hypothetical protein